MRCRLSDLSEHWGGGIGMVIGALGRGELRCFIRALGEGLGWLSALEHREGGIEMVKWEHWEGY